MPWASPPYTPQQVRPAQPSVRTDGVLATQPVHSVPQDRGQGVACLVHMVEQPLVHHLPVPLLVFPSCSGHLAGLKFC